MGARRSPRGPGGEARLARRIGGIPDGKRTGLLFLIFAASTEMLGRGANLLRIVAHSPGLAKWFLPLVAAIRQPRAGAVSSPRLPNLAVLKTSTVNGCGYSTEHNRVLCQPLGPTAAEFAVL